ncbi:MAG TPA: hypothetical protein VK988_18685, partial [Acidimicrobiales bacterium]|nr:hypothetical protein [Acidimicrobiales bacterium]
MGVLALLGGLAVPPASAAPVTRTFDFTGEPQSFVVPAGVCRITVDARGAQGGSATSFDEEQPGAPGGRTTATVGVNPEETLQVLVGGLGGDGEEVQTGPADGGAGG